MQTVLLCLYCACSVLLFLYGANCYVMLALHARGRRRRLEHGAPQRWPSVTVQLPVYNEQLVVEGLLRAVGDLDYPRDLLEVQVLDDSTDETTAILEVEVDRLRAEGIVVTLLHRQDRPGYKAGAIATEALGALLGGGASGQKAVFVTLDLAVVGLLLGIRRVGAGAVWYAWNPLVLVAFAHEGHNDSALLFLATLAWWLTERGHRVAAGLAVAGAVFAKIPAILLVPPFARRLRGCGLMAASVVVGAVLLAISGIAAPWVANLRCFGDMRFNGSLCPALEVLVAPGMSRWILGAGALAVAVLSAARRSSPSAAVLGMAALLAASPTVHPWYITWLLPFAAAAPRAWVFVWSATALLGYLPWEAVRRGQGWVEWGWVPWATYLPVVAVAVGQWFSRRWIGSRIHSPAFKGATT